jgi:protocatechuate 3,4-dioxygenase, beta subunit
MKRCLVLSLIIAAVWIEGCAQPKSSEDQGSRKVGGECEDCEAVFEYGSKKLTWIDTLPDYGDEGPKMEVTGTIYQQGGKTPAAGVILYVYHTNQEGIYPTKGNETGWAKRHGYIRGWIKTDQTGRYKFYTLRPGAYPGRRNPEHIHATVKEPNVSAYWIDEYLFDDDPILTKEERNEQKKRGGNGILKLTKDSKGNLIAHRDIILGQNIPGY